MKRFAIVSALVLLQALDTQTMKKIKGYIALYKLNSARKKNIMPNNLSKIYRDIKRVGLRWM